MVQVNRVRREDLVQINMARREYLDQVNRVRREGGPDKQGQEEGWSRYTGSGGMVV